MRRQLTTCRWLTTGPCRHPLPHPPLHPTHLRLNSQKEQIRTKSKSDQRPKWRARCRCWRHVSRSGPQPNREIWGNEDSTAAAAGPSSALASPSSLCLVVRVIKSRPRLPVRPRRERGGQWITNCENIVAHGCQGGLCAAPPPTAGRSPTSFRPAQADKSVCRRHQPGRDQLQRTEAGACGALVAGCWAADFLKKNFFL